MLLLTHTLRSTALTSLDAVAGQDAKSVSCAFTASKLDVDLATTNILFFHDVHQKNLPKASPELQFLYHDYATDYGHEILSIAL